MFSGNENEWLEFEDDDSDPIQPIVGFQADPQGDLEDWDDDFVLDDDEASDGSSPMNSSILDRRKVSQSGSSTLLGMIKSSEEDQSQVVMALLKFLVEVAQILSDVNSKFDNENFAESFSLNVPTVDEDKQVGESPSKHPETPDFEGKVEVFEWKRAIALAQEDHIEECRAYRDLGLAYCEEQRWSDAQVQFEQAFKIVETSGTKDYALEAQMLTLLGKVVRELGDCDKGLDYLLGANNIAEREDLQAESRQIMFELGECYSSRVGQELIGGRHYALFLDGVFEEFKKTSVLPWREIGTACYCLALLLHNLEALDTAEVYVKTAVLSAKQMHDASSLATYASLLESLSLEISASVDGGSRAPSVIEEDDDDLDWDKEFEVQVEPSTRPKLRLKNVLKDSIAGDDPWLSLLDNPNAAIPKRYKATYDPIGQVQILKYPKPTMFFNLRTSDGRKFLNEASLELWIVSLVSKHIPNIKQTAIHDYKRELSNHVDYVEKYSKKWCEAFLILMTKLLRLGKSNQAWDIAIIYFDHLNDAPSDVKSATFAGHADVLNVSIQMLQTVSLLWTPQREAQYTHMVSAAMEYSQDKSAAVQLVEAECRGHFGLVMGNSAFATAVLLCRCYETAKQNGESHEKAGLAEMEASTTDVAFTNSAHIRAAALADIHLLMTELSPLTAEELPESTDELGFGHIPMPGVFLEREDSDINYDQAILSDTVYRMDTLLELYPLLPETSVVRAKCAYVLGIYSLQELENAQQAEELFFECLYVLDQCDLLDPSLPHILDGFATDALVSYGDVLLLNYKYKYGVVALESAATLLRHRKSPGYDALLRRLAGICAENNDWKRSLLYYLKILERSQELNKTNEIIYVCQVISNMYLERGDFRLAEHFLALSLSQLQLSHVAIPRGSDSKAPAAVDTQHLSLLLKVAQVRLRSLHVDRSIVLLEAILSWPLSYRRLADVVAVAAHAFLKRFWPIACITAIESADRVDGRIKQPTQSQSQQQRHFRRAYLSAKACSIAGEYENALAWIDALLEEVPKSSLAFRGKCYLLRGKILHALIGPPGSSSVNFPTDLTPGSQRARLARASAGPRSGRSKQRKAETIEPPTPDSPVSVFNSIGELVQECFLSLHRAFDYFRAVSDDCRIAKTAAFIAESRLERVFAPVALLKLPYEQAAVLPSLKSPRLNALAAPPSSTDSPKVMSSSNEGVVSSGEMRMSDVEPIAMLGLDISAECGMLIPLLNSYMNIAELHVLQDHWNIAYTFWSECRDTFFKLFVDDTSVPLAASSSISFGLVAKLERLLCRLCRFLYCCEADVINENLAVIDTYLQLQLDFDRAKRRPLATSFTDMPDAITPLPGLTQSTSVAPPLRTGSTFFDGSAPRLTSEEERIDAVSSPEDRMWACFHRTAIQRQFYSAGMIQRDELMSRNQIQVRKLAQIMQAARLTNTTSWTRRQSVGPPRGALTRGLSRQRSVTSMLGTPRNRTGSTQQATPWWTPSSLLAEAALPPASGKPKNDRFRRLIFIVRIGNLIAYYVPWTGQKRVHVFSGGIFGAESLPDYADRIKKAGTKERAPSSASDSDSADFSRSSSVGSSQSSARNGLTTQVAAAVGLSGSPDISGSGNDMSPLLSAVEASSEKSTSSAGTEPRHPIRQRTPSNLHTVLGLANQAGGQSLAHQTIGSLGYVFPPSALTIAMRRFIARLIVAPRDGIDAMRSNSDEYQSLLTAMGRSVFYSPVELVPSGAVREKVPSSTEENHVGWHFKTMFPFHRRSQRDTVLTIPSSPFVVIASTSLSVVPWELLSDKHGVVRAFTLSSLIHHESSDYSLPRSMSTVTTSISEAFNPESSEMSVFPQFFAISRAKVDDGKAQADADRTSKDFAVAEALSRMSHTKRLVYYDRMILPGAPYHTALVKRGRLATSYRRKYKYVHFLTINDGTPALVREVRNFMSTVDAGPSVALHAIMLLSYSDLVEITSQVFNISKLMPQATLVFVPDMAMKPLVKRFMKAIEEKSRSGSYRGADMIRRTAYGRWEFYEFLMKTVVKFQQDYNVPVAVISPPTLAESPKSPVVAPRHDEPRMSVV